MKAIDFDFTENRGKSVTVETHEKIRTGKLLGLMPDNIVVLDMSESFGGQLALSEIELNEIVNIDLS
ncbi:MAG TPA: hypothetical protein GXZ87_06560 [Bacteroidales bacterium]|nr:hypothetical protein [Bacteroidales bacterium]